MLVFSLPLSAPGSNRSLWLTGTKERGWIKGQLEMSKGIVSSKSFWWEVLSCKPCVDR